MAINKSAKKKALVTIEEHNVLFGTFCFGSFSLTFKGNMESILGLHLGIMKGLHSRLAKWDDKQTIADVFVEGHTSVCLPNKSVVNHSSVQFFKTL